MFDPIPLDNNCCLQKIDKNYNYYSYFIDKNDFIKELLDILRDYNLKKQIIYSKLKTIKTYIYSEQPDKEDFEVCNEDE